MKTKILASIASLLILSSCSYYVTHPAMVNTPHYSADQYTYTPPAVYTPPAAYDPPSAYNPEPLPPGITYQVFYDQLSPYGSWIADPNYGYVWIPAGGPGFTPYCTNGHWVFTEYGWAWVSAYNWGWAPYHYGRWVYDSWYGWEWVPGYEWAPAWVQWGQYGNYYGWTPLPPNYGPHGGYRPPAPQWTFIPHDKINQSNITNYVVNNTTFNNYNIILSKDTNTFDQHTFYSGPKQADVELATGVKLTPVKITEGTKAGADVVSDNKLVSYHPTVSTSTTGVKPAPTVVVKKETLTPVTSAVTSTSPKDQGGIKTTTVTPKVTTATPKDQGGIKTTTVTPTVTTATPKDQGGIKTTTVTPTVTTATPKDQRGIRSTTVIPATTTNKDENGVKTTPVTPVRTTTHSGQIGTKTNPVEPIDIRTSQTNKSDTLTQPAGQKGVIAPLGTSQRKNDTYRSVKKNRQK
jgi:hypothetical protein